MVNTRKGRQRKKKAKLLYDSLNVAISLNCICLNHGQLISQQMVPDYLHPVTNSISKTSRFSVIYKI